MKNNKAIKTLSLAVFLFPAIIYGQSVADRTAFNAGKIIISAGYGYPSKYLSLGGANYPSYFNNPIFSNDGFNGDGTFYFKSEYGLSRKIGIGINLDYDNLQYVEQTPNMPNYVPHYPQSFFTSKQTTTSIAGLIRVNYHYATAKKLDPYFGIGAGLRKTANTYTTDNPYSNASPDDTHLGIAFEAVAGLRYYFTPHIGIYSEFGVAKSIIQMGISVRF